MTLHCDEASRSVLAESEKIVPATEEDFDTEFLDLDLAVKVVEGVEEAIEHINQHGSHHTDLILCAPLSQGDGTNGAKQNPAAVRFTSALSSANVYVNASTRFADGFRYGFGTEVGISTGRTHARGPVGLEGLVIYKYILKGEGDTCHTAVEFNAGANGDTASKRQWSHTDLERQYPTL